MNDITGPLIALQKHASHYLHSFRMEDGDIYLETNFGLSLCITGADVTPSEVTITDMPSEAAAAADIQSNTSVTKTPDKGTENLAQHSEPQPASKQTESTDSPSQRCISIRPDYDTDFVWLEPDDPKYNHEENVSYVELDELALDLRWPDSFKSSFQSWVATWNEGFRTRCMDPGDFKASVFSTPAEEVAWMTAGLLLAWKIAHMSAVREIVYQPIRTEYVLRREAQKEVTLKFLRDMNEKLKEGGVDPE